MYAQVIEGFTKIELAFTQGNRVGQVANLRLLITVIFADLYLLSHPCTDEESTYQKPLLCANHYLLIRYMCHRCG